VNHLPSGFDVHTATPLPPIRDQYGGGHHTVRLNDRPFRKLEAFASSHRIPFVNATSAFRQDAAPASLFLGNDFHFTPRGPEIYGGVLARFITDHSLIDSDEHAGR
jgi:hypothetical protein